MLAPWHSTVLPASRQEKHYRSVFRQGICSSAGRGRTSHATRQAENICSTIAEIPGALPDVRRHGLNTSGEHRLTTTDYSQSEYRLNIAHILRRKWTTTDHSQSENFTIGLTLLYFNIS